MTGTHLQRKYEAEKQRLDELNSLWHQVERKIKEQSALRQREGGIYACRARDLKNVKQLKFLEIRVNDQKRKSSQIEIRNEKLKEQINRVRQKLQLFNTIHASLSDEFKEEESRMAELLRVQ